MAMTRSHSLCPIFTKLGMIDMRYHAIDLFRNWSDTGMHSIRVFSSIWLNIESIKKLFYVSVVGGDFLNCEGAGLYPLQSKCNHSCQPNAEVSFENGDHK